VESFQALRWLCDCMVSGGGACLLLTLTTAWAISGNMDQSCSLSLILTGFVGLGHTLCL
jgi:hypothetical protein